MPSHIRSIHEPHERYTKPCRMNGTIRKNCKCERALKGIKALRKAAAILAKISAQDEMSLMGGVSQFACDLATMGWVGCQPLSLTSRLWENPSIGEGITDSPSVTLGVGMVLFINKNWVRSSNSFRRLRASCTIIVQQVHENQGSIVVQEKNTLYNCRSALNARRTMGQSPLNLTNGFLSFNSSSMSKLGSDWLMW